MTGRNRDFTDDFKKEAVRLSFESGRTVEQVAKDLGIGKSTLNTWRRQFRDADLAASPPKDLEKKIHAFAVRTKFFAKNATC